MERFVPHELKEMQSQPQALPTRLLVESLQCRVLAKQPLSKRRETALGGGVERLFEIFVEEFGRDDSPAGIAVLRDKQYDVTRFPEAFQATLQKGQPPRSFEFPHPRISVFGQRLDDRFGPLFQRRTRPRRFIRSCLKRSQRFGYVRSEVSHSRSDSRVLRPACAGHGKLHQVARLLGR